MPIPVNRGLPEDRCLDSGQLRHELAVGVNSPNDATIGVAAQVSAMAALKRASDMKVDEITKWHEKEVGAPSPIMVGFAR